MSSSRIPPAPDGVDPVWWELQLRALTDHISSIREFPDYADESLGQIRVISRLMREKVIDDDPEFLRSERYRLEAQQLSTLRRICEIGDALEDSFEWVGWPHEGVGGLALVARDGKAASILHPYDGQWCARVTAPRREHIGTRDECVAFLREHWSSRYFPEPPAEGGG